MKQNRDPNNLESEDNFSNEAINDGLRILARMIAERVVADRVLELQDDSSEESSCNILPNII